MSCMTALSGAVGPTQPLSGAVFFAQNLCLVRSVLFIACVFFTMRVMCGSPGEPVFKHRG